MTISNCKECKIEEKYCVSKEVGVAIFCPPNK
jgi:hypothetical protein